MRNCRVSRAAFLFFLVCSTANLIAQEVELPQATESQPDKKDEISAAPESVKVTPTADDSEISARLKRILDATEWFENPNIRVDEGVAFLTGTTNEEKYQKWAGDLAQNTEDVVAVVNRIEVREKDIWDLSPAIVSLQTMGREAIQSIPNIIAAALIVLLTLLGMFVSGRVADGTILSRIDNNLIRAVLRKVILGTMFLFGMYLVLRVAGLTRLAATVIGGTGIFGLIIGIAFRDIAENFLASILISLQNPFRYGDLIEVEGLTGYVQRVNTRGTLLMSLDGNHIQIPNATIYKNIIRNFTSNPNMRLDFIIGIGYDGSISDAQSLIVDVLRKHPAILDDPEPTVLVDELGSSTVNLRVYFWINGREYSNFKVKSAIMRLVTRTLEAANISMPPDAREIVFPSAVPVQMLPELAVDAQPIAADRESQDSPNFVQDMDLDSEAKEIREQARQSRDPEEDASDLLEGSKKQNSGNENGE